MSTTASPTPINTRSVLPSKGVALAILVAALGYFVDIYDLILFSIVRITSLRSIGVPEDQILSQGVLLLNMQMGGMLIGGLIWGVLGDKRGLARGLEPREIFGGMIGGAGQRTGRHEQEAFLLGDALI